MHDRENNEGVEGSARAGLMGSGVKILGVVVLLLAALAWWNRGSEEAPAVEAAATAPMVGAARATLQEIEQHIEALGTTSSWESIEVRSTVADVVQTIHFSDGQAVHRNDALVTLVQDEERAKLAESRAFFEEQQREVKRIEGLVESKSVSRNQLDERRTLLEIARQRVAGAQAAVDDRTIRAPFDGVLGLRNLSPGALVTPETVITTLDDIVSLRLDFPVPSVFVATLRVGLELKAATPALANRNFSGKIIGIDTRVNPVDRSIMVRARIDNSALLLKPGMLLNVDIHHGRHQALMIPEQAILHYQRDHFVLWVDSADGNRLHKRQLQTGQRMAGSVEVIAGLVAGDLVVIEGLTVRPGTQTRVREIAPAEAKSET